MHGGGDRPRLGSGAAEDELATIDGQDGDVPRYPTPSFSWRAITSSSHGHTVCTGLINLGLRSLFDDFVTRHGGGDPTMLFGPPGKRRRWNNPAVLCRPGIPGACCQGAFRCRRKRPADPNPVAADLDDSDSD